METLATCYREEDIFIAVKNACIRFGLDLKYLRGICTDGAPAITGNQQGFVTRLLDYVSNEYDNKELINRACKQLQYPSMFRTAYSCSLSGLIIKQKHE